MSLSLAKVLTVRLLKRAGYFVLTKRDFEQRRQDADAAKAEISALKIEIHKLKTQLQEATPQIDYQVLMDHIAKLGAFNNLEPAFHTHYERVKSCSMTSIEALYAMHKAVEYVVRAGIPGDIVECGVWRGGSMMMAALTLLALGDTSHRLVLFDTFAGHPRPDPERDGQGHHDAWAMRRRTDKASDWADVSIDDVRRNLESTGYPMDKVAFVKGVVEETILPNRPEAIALLRLDTDWYESTAHELKYLYPRLSELGILIIDDYGTMPGARQAVDEYFVENRLPLLLNRIDFGSRIAIKAQSR